ncbi:E3 Ubiquitin-Protein Ligase Hecw2 [Manis pentadactyla]|nr:E3 Ubiquitin-Protein Ligase Hecw2 [Manis pentadactyla]
MEETIEIGQPLRVYSRKMTTMSDERVYKLLEKGLFFPPDSWLELKLSLRKYLKSGYFHPCCNEKFRDV